MGQELSHLPRTFGVLARKYFSLTNAHALQRVRGADSDIENQVSTNFKQHQLCAMGVRVIPKNGLSFANGYISLVGFIFQFLIRR